LPVPASSTAACESAVSSPKPVSSLPSPALADSRPASEIKPDDRFADVGAYGFRRSQTAILAALVTEDPLLLIGQSGTGKTFLLNSISEALGLEHRHYNASLISFDDLVGFPYPDDARESVRFLETPATIWGAECVLIDEISRCKPEHQNRLFSLVHERRIQGIALGKLRHRWAAMNPCTADQGGAEDYLGSEPLDPALADRFAVIIEVGDWGELSRSEQRRVADPSGEGVRGNDSGRLRSDLAEWRRKFLRQLDSCPPVILDYVCIVVASLGGAGIRVSPRRARLLTRTLLAAIVIEGDMQERVFRQILHCSLPQRAWGEEPDETKVNAAHRVAWDASLLPESQKWIHEFHLCKTLYQKTRLLLKHCPSPDVGSLVVEQLLANEPRERAAAFALALYPAALAGKLPIGHEGVNDLGRVASALIHVEGELRWQERFSEKNTRPPELTRLSRVLSKLEGSRLERARQLFCWCMTEKIVLEKPHLLEQDFNRCVHLIAKRAAQ
jgi:MoxR-like ATPase